MTRVAAGLLVLALSAGASNASAQARFLRGDADHDGSVAFNDMFAVLDWINGVDNLTCEDAADANDDGFTDLSDVITLSGYLFLGTRPPAAPFPAIGGDATADPLGCAANPANDEAPSARVVVRDPEVLNRFSFQRTLDQLIELSPWASQNPEIYRDGVADTTEYYQVSWWDYFRVTCNTPLFPRTLPNDCHEGEMGLGDNLPFRDMDGDGDVDPEDVIANGDAYIPIAIFNRFDLADPDGLHCGEQRIVYGKVSGITRRDDRNLIIFEARIPNPRIETQIAGIVTPGTTRNLSLPDPLLEGDVTIDAPEFDPGEADSNRPLSPADCAPLVELWEAAADSDLETRADMLEALFYGRREGESGPHPLASMLPGFDQPAIHPDHFRPGTGSVRANTRQGTRQWRLRHFSLREFAIRGGGGYPTDYLLQRPPQGVPDRSLLRDDPGSTADDELRSVLVTQVETLLDEPLEPIQIPTGLRASHDETHGRAPLPLTPMLELELQAELDRISAERGASVALSPRQIMDRLHAGTCAGCHRDQANEDLGASTAGASPFFVPSSLGFLHVNERGQLSDGLLTRFLPEREAFLDAYLAGLRP